MKAILDQTSCETSEWYCNSPIGLTVVFFMYSVTLWNFMLFNTLIMLCVHIIQFAIVNVYVNIPGLTVCLH